MPSRELSATPNCIRSTSFRQCSTNVLLKRSLVRWKLRHMLLEWREETAEPTVLKPDNSARCSSPTVKEGSDRDRGLSDDGEPSLTVGLLHRLRTTTRDHA